MVHLMLLFSVITVAPNGNVDIEERMANETVIVSPESPILNQTKTESDIVIDAPYSNPEPSWIDGDVVIDSTHDYQAISVATRRSTGEIFVAASRCASAGENYRLFIWSSPDGINWSQYATISSTSNSMYNPSLNIFTTADSEYLLMAFETRDTATNECNLRSYRKPFDCPPTILDISVYPGIEESEPDLCNSDLQFPNDPWLFCTFISGDSIAFVRSVDYGKT